MRSEAACELWRERLSQRMDDDPGAPTDAALDQHLSTCAACGAYEERLHELRRNLRLMPLEPTPDVATNVMAEIRSTEGSSRFFRMKLATVGAAAAALLVLATALPVLDDAPDVARGAEITQRAFAAGRSLDSYHANFEITERGWHPAIDMRTFDAEIWFRAPETFRLRVRDRTSYPSSEWPDNDVDVVSTPSRWSIRESFSCPPAALPGCAIAAGSEERSVVNRQPFDGVSDAPRDLIVPLDSLSSSEVFEVVGTGRIRDHDAYHLSLPYRHAFPLVEALQIGGSWTDLGPRDDVELWVDQQTGFPLKFEVTRRGRLLLRVVTTSLREPRKFAGSTFDAPLRGSTADGGFEPGRGPSGEDLPTYVADLAPYLTGSNAQRQRIATYADGLSYLKVIADDRAKPLPSLAASAEIVRLRPDSHGFYRPAEPGAPRRVDIYGRNRHVQISSNLRRADLLRIAASVPLEGTAPRRVRDGRTIVERLSLEQALVLPFAEVPTETPRGYRLAAAVRVVDRAGDQLILRYSPAESGTEAADITIIQSPGANGLAPSSEDLEAVPLDGSLGRWSPLRSELEWVDEDGVYHAIAAPAFELEYLVRLAEALK